MKRFVSVLCLVFMFCLVLSSCDSVDVIRPVSALLSPPLYYEEYEELVQTFNTTVGKGALLCSPQNGSHKSAIVVEDIDSDGETEALIFYKSKAEDTVVRMHYFNVSSGKWVSTGDFSGYGNEIESVVVEDMDGDGFKELIVTWSITGVTSSNVMSVYRATYMTGKFKEISNETCIMCEVVDVDSDFQKEIFYISQSNTSGVIQKTAKVMKLSGDSVLHMGETKIDPNISTYKSFKTEKSSGDSPMKIYIDALKGENSMITELIYWDKANNELVAPLIDPETLANNVTFRFEPILSSDINNDGIIDIPVQSEIFANGDDSATIDVENVYLTRWYNFKSATESETVANTLINYSDGYMIYLENDELASVGIRNYRSHNCWVVYKVRSNGDQQEIFSVMKVPASRWDEKKFEAYIPIIEKKDSTVCVYITPSGRDSGIDEDYIREKVIRLP
ncbi:MAG: VCBS repeat-containing protein [Clostridia bacterium]|nr:VCBS repeat-containing protein [Clostridia bacterium]